MIYYRHADGRTVGPVTKSNVRELRQEGKITDATLVRVGKAGGWQPYKAFALSRPDGPSADRFYCQEADGSVSGPLTWESLARLHTDGLLDGATPVASENCPDWMPYQQLANSDAPTANGATHAARFTYLDDAGNRVGPFPYRTLDVLHQQGAITGETAVIDQSGRVYAYATLYAHYEANLTSTAGTLAQPPEEPKTNQPSVSTTRTADAARQTTENDREQSSRTWSGASVLIVAALIGIGIYAKSPTADDSESEARSIRDVKDFAVICPNLPILRRYVEENRERFGGEGCAFVAGEYQEGLLLDEHGDYVRVRLVTKYGEVEEGFMKRRDVVPR